MTKKNETPRGGGVSGNSCGGTFLADHTHKGTARPAASETIEGGNAANSSRQLRADIYKARDWAARMLGNTCSTRAYEYAYDAHQIAGESLFAQASERRLRAARDFCRALVKSAMLAEQLDLDCD